MVEHPPRLSLSTRIALAQRIAATIAENDLFHAVAWSRKGIVRVYVTYQSRSSCPMGHVDVRPSGKIVPCFDRQRGTLESILGSFMDVHHV